MKFSLVILLFTLFSFGNVFAASAESSSAEVLESTVANKQEAVGPVRTMMVRFCYYPNFGVRRCITITISTSLEEYDGKELDVKATLSEDGQTLTFSGIPAPLNGETLKVEERAYSGFAEGEKKLYLQPGTYKILNGSVQIKLKKG